jgi:hypothetical protein
MYYSDGETKALWNPGHVAVWMGECLSVDAVLEVDRYTIYTNSYIINIIINVMYS